MNSEFVKQFGDKKFFTGALVGFCLLFVPTGLLAQFYNGSQLSFGKNRVQHQQYNWQYMRAMQYDVYFYPTGKELAQYVYLKTPQIIAEIEKLLNFTSTKKLQLIVYNTQSDFRESNFAYDDEDFYNQGGVTNIYGTKIYLYFDGNRRHFDRMLRSGIMNVYAHWLVQGQSVGSNIAYESIMNVPNWYYSGLSSYFGETWNNDVEAHVKDGILSKYYADFDDLSTVEATYAGHSFWKYVSDIYGESSIPKILRATRSTHSMERGFLHATGIPYRALLINWYKYYYLMLYPDMHRSSPNGNGLVKNPHSNRHYGQFRFSPDGKSYAYVTNQAGRVKIWLKTPTNKHPVCILTRYPKIEENPDLTFPLLAWHPQGTILGMNIEYKGHCYYIPYNMESRKWGKRLLVDVEKITSWQYSDDGSTMLFSGFKNGQSDIYIYSFLSHSYINLTRDFYDDCDPVFLHGGRQIVFASNRNRDTINLPDDIRNAQPMKTYDLFLYQYDKNDPALLRITNTPLADEYAIKRLSDNQILYLGNDCGLQNRYMAQFDSAVSRIDTAIHFEHFAKSHIITDMAYSILEHDYNALSDTAADIMLKDGHERIFLSPLHSLDTLREVAPTKFRNMPLERHSGKDDLQTVADSLTTNGIAVQTEASSRPPHGHVIAREADRQPEKKDSITEKTLSEKENIIIPVARFYKPSFSVDKLIAQADFSFLNNSYQQFEGSTSPIYLNTGFNTLFMVGINDLFEDYRIIGGIRVSVDLRNNEFMLSFENLARRIDRQFVLYRRSITSQISDYVFRQRSGSLFYRLSYPFNKVHSLRLTLSGRLENNIAGAVNDAALRTPDGWHVWCGAKLEYVYDASKELYTNLWRGTKIKIFGEYEQRLEKDRLNLFVIGVDARHSIKLYRNMTFAVRAAASTNTGSARLVYYMGGVDNWINAKFNSTIWVDQTKNYAYQTLATNMRGFRQNIRNGTSFVLLSSELRIPFVQLLARHKVASAFLNSFQLNLFADYGTAWTGLTPYSENNCLYTRHVTSGYVHAEITRQVDPFVGGIGLGLRASILGYFLRIDYAWGVEDFKISNKKGMLLLSLSTDF